MSEEELITEDGENYTTGFLDDPIVTYEFGDEGMKLMNAEDYTQVGQISWQEQASSGGDTYIPANMRLSVNSDKSIILGFDNGSEEQKNAVSIGNIGLGGTPQLSIPDGGIHTGRIYTPVVDLLGANNASHGTSIFTNEHGGIMFHHRQNGVLWEVSLADILTELGWF